MARVIAVALSKGGTGKTTTAVNLAAGLARAGQRVLLCDTDTQGQAAFFLGVAPGAGLAELATAEASADDCIIKAREGLYLLAGGRSLAGVKRMIDRRDIGAERVIAEALEGLTHNGRTFDTLILDCSPGWDALSINALFASDQVLAPVSCEAAALQGLGEFTKSLGAVQRYKDVRLAYVLPTFADARVRKTREVLDQLGRHYGRQLCKPIRYSVKLSQAAGHGQSIFEYAPASTGAEDYAALTEKIANGKE